VALRDKNGTYIIDRFSSFSLPSASVLRYCRPKEKPSAYKVLAIGNPDLHNPGFDLPFAAKEVESISWEYPGTQAFFRQDATETNVKTSIGDYDIVHFACHGEFDRENPLFSGLLLATDDQNDGRLEVHEIFGLNLKATLVTLSACETGLGKIEKGDDVVGVSRAFIYAGTSSIIASLWKISDVASAVLIKRFYRNLKTEPKVDALRSAQLFIKEKFKHPAYWASFVLTGSYQ
jgi:CHAT domain-containing protein